VPVNAMYVILISGVDPIANPPLTLGRARFGEISVGPP
jgi:hypothetical protein